MHELPHAGLQVGWHLPHPQRRYVVLETRVVSLKKSSRAREVVCRSNVMLSATNESTKWLTIKTFTYGFLTGIVCLRAVRVYQTRRLPSTKKIQLAILPMLRANNEIRKNIGSSLKPGLLSAYAYKGGLKWRLPYLRRGSSWMSLIPFSYKPWSISILFQVIGDKETGLVSLETSPARDGETIGINSVLVDFKDGQRLVLRGSVTQSGESVEYENISD